MDCRADQIDVERIDSDTGARTFFLVPGWARFVVVGVCAFTALLVFAKLPSWDSSIFTIVFLAPIGWLEYRLTSTVLIAAPGGVTVRNVFSTHHVEWHEVREAEFRTYGPCRLRLLDGRSLGLFALQQSNWRQMTNRPLPSLVSAIEYLNERAKAGRDARSIPSGYPLVRQGPGTGTNPLPEYT